MYIYFTKVHTSQWLKCNDGWLFIYFWTKKIKYLQEIIVKWFVNTHKLTEADADESKCGILLNRFFFSRSAEKTFVISNKYWISNKVSKIEGYNWSFSLSFFECLDQWSMSNSLHTLGSHQIFSIFSTVLRAFLYFIYTRCLSLDVQGMRMRNAKRKLCFKVEDVHILKFIVIA